MNMIKNFLKDDYVIMSATVHENLCFVRLMKNRLTEIIVVHATEVLITLPVQISCTEAIVSRASDSLVWDCDRYTQTLRAAAIAGITLGGNAQYGLNAIDVVLPLHCTMAYDIETVTGSSEGAAFPQPYMEILSICVKCSCGIKRAWCSTTAKVAWYTGNLTSKAMCDGFIEFVTLHSPVFLIGYNNFQFDNVFIAYHCGERYKDIMMPIRSSVHGKVKYAYYINIKCTNNVDVYAYMDKVHRSRFSSLSLGAVAAALQVEAKSTMPSVAADEDMTQLVLYNMNDCIVTLAVWNKMQLAQEMTSLCSVSKSPLQDCCRYVTGTMMSCMLASHCRTIGAQIGWSRSKALARFSGGLVLEPRHGLYASTVIADYASMYPSIMIDCNISFESTIIAEGTNNADGAVDWDNSGVAVSIANKSVSFNTTTRSIVCTVLRRLKLWRQQYQKGTNMSTTIKVASNSIFGALGYENSSIHSPYASAAVTAIGRWCLALSVAIFNVHDLNVVYGDTDSCFITSRDGGHIDINTVMAAVHVLHNVLKYTPLKSMRMEVDRNTAKSMIIVSKKRYATMSTDGVITVKGLSVARKDRVKVVRDVSLHVLTLLLHNGNTEATLEVASKYVWEVMMRAVSGAMTLEEVSSIVRYEGTVCYKYSAHKDTVMVPVNAATTSMRPRYSRNKIVTAIINELKTLLTSTGIITLQRFFMHTPMEDEF